MAREWWYNPGDNWLLDDLSGFKIRRSRSARIPGGQTGNAIVAPERWEPQQPQDFVRGIPDDQLPPVVRPRQENMFVVVGTEVTAFAGRGSTTIQVAGTRGFLLGALCQVPLDNGDLFLFRITGITGNSLSFQPPMPGTVGGSFADPILNSVLQLEPRPSGLTFILGTPGNDILGVNVLG